MLSLFIGELIFSASVSDANLRTRAEVCGLTIVLLIKDVKNTV